MKKFFQFRWKEREKYNTGFVRTNTVIINSNIEDIGINAHAATEVFCSNFGALTKVEIVEIQELDAGGNPIGEPIRPMGEATILPTV